VTNNKYVPYDRCGTATPYFPLLIVHLQQTQSFSTHIPHKQKFPMFIN